ncbi:MAG: Cof-like hydrolase [Oscillospiraceae bacterium]|nr:Cof-like hydrolase [Oscillospiraceae bacterium]
MNIKLIATDLDGTILDSESNLSKANELALQKAIEQGILVVPSTGRVLNQLPRSISRLSGVQYVISSNGAVITDIRQNKHVYLDLISINALKSVLEVLDKYEVLLEIYLDDEAYVQKSSLEHLDDYQVQRISRCLLENSCTVVDNLERHIFHTNEPAEKLNIRFKNIEIYQSVWAELEALSEIAVTSSGWDCIEIITATANKGNALKYLCDMLHISRENVMAIGDGLNDKEMLQFTGVSVAMGNSSEELKKEADFITLKNIEDGFAYAIQKYALK